MISLVSGAQLDELANDRSAERTSVTIGAKGEVSGVRAVEAVQLVHAWSTPTSASSA
jgi:hypothetical protein